MGRKAIAVTMLFVIPIFFQFASRVPAVAWGTVLADMGASTIELIAFGVGAAAICSFSSFATVGVAAFACSVAAVG